MKAIVFDCFGVLYVNPVHLFYETYVPHFAQLKEKLHDLNKQADYGIITQQELIDRVAELSGLDKAFIQDNILGEHTRNKPLLDFAQALRGRHKIGLLSNISPGSMDTFFTKQERSELFDGVVLSGEVGTIKPYPEIYQIMAERLELSVSDCIMIDDVIDNCYGADAAGMKWIHYQSNLQCIAEIKSFLT